MTVRELCEATCENDHIYPSVLRRNFGYKAIEVKAFLLDKEYAKASLGYRCPFCNFLVGGLHDKEFVDSLDRETAYCYNCDNEFQVRDYSEELVLIRTDKKWSED
jgi:hypothetical protein